MLNKRLNKKNKVRYSLNPYKIDNYNKFLITLDKNSLDTKPEENENENEKDIDFLNKTIASADTLLEQINKSIEETKEQIRKNNELFNKELDTPFFSGQNKFDLLLDSIELNDPNLYEEFFFQDKGKDKDKKKIKRVPTPKNELEITPQIKTKVQIDKEINSIDDLLFLIENYKLDPSVEYNINMKALHNIKEPLEDLKNMVGMKSLKTNIVDQILYFVQNLHMNNESGDFMHTVIYGPPGTGKTEISKIMGKIFSKMGVLEKDRFIKVTRSDLIAGYLGQTAIKTKDVIKDALGGVLFIDEAYALGNSEKRDSFSKECIDTLCEALSDYKNELMVIIAGYEEELKECFFSYNQGLDSRFTWRFKTDEYTGEDLYHIFVKKVKEIGWDLDNNESKITPDWFKKNIDYFKFYGRDVETILSKTKIAHSKRVFCKPEEYKKKITFVDLENGFKIYIENNEVKKRQEREYLKKQIYSSIYC